MLTITPPSEELFHSLLNCSSDVFYRIATEHGLMHGHIVFVSQSVTAITGHHPTEFATHPSLWASLIHPEDIHTVFATTKQMAESRRPVVREYRLKGADGSYRWMEDRVFPLIDDQGALTGYQGVARDISASRHAEADAASARQRLQAVLETARIATWEWHVGSQQVAYSAEWCRLLGLGDRAQHATIDLWQERLDPHDRTRVIGALHAALAGPGSRFTTSYRLVAADGLELRVLGSWAVARRDADQATDVLGVEIDISDYGPL